MSVEVFEGGGPENHEGAAGVLSDGNSEPQSSTHPIHGGSVSRDGWRKLHTKSPAGGMKDVMRQKSTTAESESDSTQSGDDVAVSSRMQGRPVDSKTSSTSQLKASYMRARHVNADLSGSSKDLCRV